MSAVVENHNHHDDHHHGPKKGIMRWLTTTCLLYTSDAADE